MEAGKATYKEFSSNPLEVDSALNTRENCLVSLLSTRRSKAKIWIFELSEAPCNHKFFQEVRSYEQLPVSLK